PGVPRRPPGNAVRGVPLSVFDRLRDLAQVGGPMARRTAWTAIVAAGTAGLVRHRLLRSARRRSDRLRRSGRLPGRD
ncbi:hypothetical protein NGM37_29195, partial [Streptomyces sp. TRM76130]|nr:hypothetical protein [Streptomyces sp. TRM76130]